LMLNADPMRVPVAVALAPASLEVAVPLLSYSLKGEREGPDIPPPIYSLTFF